MVAPTGAYVLRDALVSIEGTDYANQCTTAVLTPETATQTIKTMVPDGSVSDTDSATWTLSLAGIQDYRDGAPPNGGLARYLTDNAGTKATLILEPKKGGVSATVEVTLKAVAFGGPQGSFAVFDIELPCDGAPEFEDPA